MSQEYTPIVYRMTRKMAREAFSKLNDKGIYLSCIKTYLDKDTLRDVVGTKLTGVSSVYVCDDRRIMPKNRKHNLLSFNKEYTKYHGQQPIYGNIIIILGDKTYHNLPEGLKTIDINSIIMF